MCVGALTICVQCYANLETECKFVQTPEASSHLFCWLEFKVSRIWTLGPLKMEFLSRNPDVVQIHQAFAGSDVTGIMTEIGDILNCSVDAKTDGPMIIKWLLDSSSSFSLSHVIEEGINKKVEAMTGLRSSETSASDPAIVMNHLPGGLLEHIHTDLVCNTKVSAEISNCCRVNVKRRF